MARIFDSEMKAKLADVAKTLAKKTGEAAMETMIKAGEKASEIDVKAITKSVTDAGKSVATVSEDKVAKIKEVTVDKLDANGDGQVTIDDVIVKALQAPGIHVDRAKFLQRELFKRYPQEVIDRAIETTPAAAGVSKEDVNKIVDEVIKYERDRVSGISTLLGVPGSFASLATIPADIMQYYGFTLRAMQKMLYMYGFPEIDASEEEGVQLDSGTINEIIICLGSMYGVAGANNAIKGMALALGKGVEKQLMKMALTKGAVYPVVKNILKWFGVNLTKKIFTGFIGKAIPVVGGVIGGGVTFLSFKPCCEKLKAALEDTYLSNPDYRATDEDNKIMEGILNGTIIEGEFADITEEEPTIEVELPEKTVEPAEYDPMDLNRDGVVDEKDMEILRQIHG